MSTLTRPLSRVVSKVPTERDLKEVDAEVAAIQVVDEKSDSPLMKSADDALRLVGTRAAVFDDEIYRRVRRKVDCVVPPLCAAVYFTQFLDKNILSYASIMGLPITGINYNNVAMAFYLGFLVFQFPTQYIAQKFPLGKYLGVNVTLWGVIVILHSVAPTFGPFYALRFILGMLETCVAPILILIISMWYKKNEQATRISSFYMMNGLTQIFGGFIAYGITFYTGPMPQWKMIYIILGCLAVLVGICVLIWMPDSPVTAKFLTQEERRAALERVRDNQTGTHNKEFKVYQVKEAVMDPRVWLEFILVMTIGLPNGAMSSFGNLIMKSFGFTSRQSLILGTPSGAIAACSVIAFGFISDYFSDRMTFMALVTLPSLLGMALMTGFQYSGKKGVLLFSVYVQGLAGPSYPLLYAWNASNIGGHTKKITVNAIMQFTFGLGNVVGSYLFLPANAPGYIPGKIAIVILYCVFIVGCLIVRFLNTRLNTRKRAAIMAVVTDKHWTEADVQHERDKSAFLDLTDRENPYFVYTR